MVLLYHSLRQIISLPPPSKEKGGWAGKTRATLRTLRTARELAPTLSLSVRVCVCPPLPRPLVLSMHVGIFVEHLRWGLRIPLKQLLGKFFRLQQILFYVDISMFHHRPPGELV